MLGLRRALAFGVMAVCTVVATGAAAGCTSSTGGGDVAGRAGVWVSPDPGTPTASPETGISFRSRDVRVPEKIEVVGSESGTHSGSLSKHPDGGGFTFTPTEPFKPGEQVRVRTDLTVAAASHGDFTFDVAYPFKPSGSKGKGSRAAAESAGSSGSSGSSQHRQKPTLNPTVRRFKSSPGLHPPKVQVLRSGQQAGDGYVFLAPKNPLAHDLPKGTMILDNNGDVVWYHPVTKAVADFKVQTYRGEQVLTWWQGQHIIGHGQGAFVVMNDQYERIARVTPGNGYQGADLHEFVITPQGTALFLIYNPVMWDDPNSPGHEKTPTLDNIVQEVDIATGTVLNEWHSLGHIGIDESYGDPIKDPQGMADYLHLNSVDVGRDGDLLLSGRHTHSVYQVDRATGEIEWRLGGKRSDFTLGENARFYYQHDVQWTPNGMLTIFDNGSATPAGPAPREQPRGLVLRLNRDAMTVSVAHAYEPPEDMRSWSQGNLQILPNGNVFIGWGSEPAYTGYGNNGDIVYDARIRGEPRRSSALGFAMTKHSYRAYRFGWEGHPTTRPSIAVAQTKGGAVHAYASWNGATEVARWQVLAGPSPEKLQPVDSAQADGFETRTTLRSNARYIAVRALDTSGNHLATSTTERPY